MKGSSSWLQTTHPTSARAVTKCSANCVENLPPQQWVPDLPFLGKSTMRTRWMAGNTSHKRCRDKSRSDKHIQTSLDCDICHKQIHVRKQISLRCDRIVHWVHLRCAGIRQSQYTDTWTCHQHIECRLTKHTYTTPPHPHRPWSKPPTHSPHTPPQPKHTSNNPLFPQDW